MWRFHKHTWATLGEKRVTIQKKKLSAYQSRIKEVRTHLLNSAFYLLAFFPTPTNAHSSQLEMEVDKLKRIRALEEEVEKLKSGGGGASLG